MNMKRLLIIAVSLIICAGANAESFKSIYNKYHNTEDADCIEMGGFLFRLMRPFAVSEMDDEGMAVIKSLNPKGMRVMDMSDAQSSVKNNFERDVRNALNGKESTILLKVRDDDDDVTISAMKTGSKYSEIVIFVTGDDCTLVVFNVDASQKELERLMKEINDNDGVQR